MKATVALVDDHTLLRNGLANLLRDLDYEVLFEADHGGEFLQKLKTEGLPQVVLMDINMPKMGGIEATEILRAKPEPYFQQVHIIALTASILNPEAGEIGGMNDYILKPFEPAILFEKLASYRIVN